DVASDGLRMHAMNDHADELPGLAASDVDLISGPQGDAAVVRARAARTVRGGGLLGKHEVELQLEILVEVFRDETAPSAALASNYHPVLDLPSGSARRPAGEVLAVEEILPGRGCLDHDGHEHEANQRADAESNRFHVSDPEFQVQTHQPFCQTINAELAEPAEKTGFV